MRYSISLRLMDREDGSWEDYQEVIAETDKDAEQLALDAADRWFASTPKSTAPVLAHIQLAEIDEDGEPIASACDIDCEANEPCPSIAQHRRFKTVQA